MKKNNKPTFNYNINGSRGLAVFLVFLFHLNLNYFNGGYVGVDIFFVISGYVISQSLLKIYEVKKISLKLLNFKNCSSNYSFNTSYGIFF